jgi:ribonuclease J
LVDRPPKEIGVLVLEGTAVGRSQDESETLASEQEVEERCVEVFRETAGMALACYSAQNIDRLVTVFRAAVRSGRELVVDLYGAAIAAATGRDSIPQVHWKHIRVYLPQAQRVRVKEAGEFWRVNVLGGSRIYVDELAKSPDRWVMSFRSSMAHELERAGCLRDARAVWLMWPGYLLGKSGEQSREIVARLGIELTVAHTSGHAAVEDLQRLANAIDADRVVPIHTDAPEHFDSLFERVEAHPDGEWWEV